VPRVSAVLSGLGDSAIVAGDFNAVPWSWTVRRITGEGRFRHVGGLGSTWLFLGLPDLLRRHVGLPIDHVLVKGGVLTLSARKLEDVGSDHLPILHEFTLLPSEPRNEVLRASLENRAARE
jgi:endonuclease/exonuclease/phosphatase (EEP) superfamily protein YafD